MNSKTTTNTFEFRGIDCPGKAWGSIEVVNNIVNMTVVSKDDNVLKAEYDAGCLQGVLQEKTLKGAITAARNNSWKNAYLTDPDHKFPKDINPNSDELAKARDALYSNFTSLLDWLNAPSSPARWVELLKRLLARMVGIYIGATAEDPQHIPELPKNWLSEQNYFVKLGTTLEYGTTPLTFMDVYFINAFNDLMDVIASSPEMCVNGIRSPYYPDKCTAFLKRIDDDIILTHNSWSGFLSQTMCQTVWVNNDGQTVNALMPGLIGSCTDFGFNNKGIMFNETTHQVRRKLEPKTEGLWIFWRAALAEQFASSIPEFFEAIKLDNTGTYLNGYMLADVKTNQTGLLEMSDRCFVEYLSDGGPYEIKCSDRKGTTEYDKEMVTDKYLMGINFPASEQVRIDLGLSPDLRHDKDNRPARRVQLHNRLPGVNCLDDARKLITYVDDPDNPLSIFGRWDLGYGETPLPKQVPDGSVDAKAATANMVKSFMNLEGSFDETSKGTGFNMLFGTPSIKGKPFIWSQSRWYWVELDNVPDRLDGEFTEMRFYLK